MTKSERMVTYFRSRSPDLPFCANCKHYHPHYDKRGFRFECGHCPYPRMKHRNSYDTCERFEKKEGLRRNEMNK